MKKYVFINCVLFTPFSLDLRHQEEHGRLRRTALDYSAACPCWSRIKCCQVCRYCVFYKTLHIELFSSVSTQTECLEKCLQSTYLYQFTCSSGVFYGDGETDNCVLNEVTRHDFPDLFREVDGDVEIVTYFEIKCDGNRQQASPSVKSALTSLLSPTSTWGSWSPCDEEKSTQYRNCPENMQPWLCDTREQDCLRHTELE